MTALLLIFKGVSTIFALSAVITGAQALLDPKGFARSFGIPTQDANGEGSKSSLSTTESSSSALESKPDPATTYISLMGVRQLATGITLFAFAYQDKWSEMALMLSVLGFVVACTDGYFLYTFGNGSKAMFHAIPGTLIATLSTAGVIGEW